MVVCLVIVVPAQQLRQRQLRVHKVLTVELEFEVFNLLVIAWNVQQESIVRVAQKHRQIVQLEVIERLLVESTSRVARIVLKDMLARLLV